MTDNTTAAREIRQGLDVHTLRSFRAFAAENPHAVIFGLEASGTAEDRAVHTHASTGPYTLGGQRIDRIARRHHYHFGAHREVEEALGFIAPTDREQETEVVLAALSGCINAVVTVSAAERALDLTGLRTDVSIRWNPAVFLHLRDTDEQGRAVDQFSEFRVTLSVTGDLTAGDIAFIRRTVRRSAVFNLLAMGRDVTVHLEHESEVADHRSTSRDPISEV